jgi:hypothetical protein
MPSVSSKALCPIYGPHDTLYPLWPYVYSTDLCPLHGLSSPTALCPLYGHMSPFMVLCPLYIAMSHRHC